MVTYTLDELRPWERQADEPPDQHAAFRLFRDSSPSKRSLVDVAEQVGVTASTTRRWADAWDWRERAAAWDDECHRTEDQERLEAIRSMHEWHRRAGRQAVVKAVQALAALNPESLPPSAIARLLELGAKLERSTLVVSVEELQGVEVYDDDEDDPWERIARELEPPASDV